MVNSYKMTAGTLVLGATPLDISAQVTKCVITVAENVTTTDAVPVLSGAELAAEDDVTFTATLEATLLQDLAAAGVVEYAWNNAGTWVDFVFSPADDTDRGVAGQVRVVPIAIGGDVKTRPTSDLTWACRGDADTPLPTFGVFDPVDAEVTEDV
jgi:hypothetical protein